MLKYREYSEEGLNLETLRAGMMPDEDFILAHKSLTLFCHDIFVEYNGKILMVERKNEPAKDAIWPLGGRVVRGMNLEESARQKVWKEAHLAIDDIQLLGIGRTYFKTDPFDHGRGTDTVNAVFYAKGAGDLRLDDLHANPLLLEASDCTPGFIEGLAPYVQDYLKAAISISKHKKDLS